MGQDKRLPDLNKSQANNPEDLLEPIPKNYIQVGIAQGSKITDTSIQCVIFKNKFVSIDPKIGGPGTFWPS